MLVPVNVSMLVLIKLVTIIDMLVPVNVSMLVLIKLVTIIDMLVPVNVSMLVLINDDLQRLINSNMLQINISYLMSMLMHQC